jgi:ABC-type branched-subunit amino acid transport system substrate-binding protein
MRPIAAAAALGFMLAAIPDDAAAHSFNVGLIIAPIEAAGTDARQVRDGFVLATRERDSHPDEESDGHLGGLDVYLYPVDLRRESLAGVRELLQRHQIDILAVIGPDGTVADIRPLLEGSQAVLLPPGRLRSPPTRAFADAFAAAFGYPPSLPAAEGYNAARRIDAAVRPLGGVGDREALRRALADTRDGLDW